MHTAGDFVVAWQSWGSSGSDSSGWSIQEQHFAADGTPLGSQVQVNTQTLGSQQLVTAAANTEAHFVLTWQSDSSNGNDNSGTSIQARLYEFDLPFPDGFESGDARYWSRLVP